MSILKFSLDNTKWISTPNKENIQVNPNAFDQPVKEIRVNDFDWEIEFEEDITEIGKFAITYEGKYSPSLYSLELPKGVKKIHGASFNYPMQHKITSNGLFDEQGICVLNGVLMACAEQEMKARIEVPEGCHTIGEYAFGEIDGKHKSPINGSNTVVLPKSIRRIEAYAFNKCHAKVNYPKGLEYIGDHAFDWPKGNILLPDTVKYIGNYAFANCDEAKRLKIGKNVEYIGEGAFSAETHSIAKIEGRYASEDNLTLVKDGVLLRFATRDMFKNNIRLRIPEGVETLGVGAIPQPFGNPVFPASLKVLKTKCITNGAILLVIPDSVIEIEENVFSSCKIHKLEGKFVTKDGTFLIYNHMLIATAIPSEKYARLIVPEGVERIGIECMSYNKIDTLVLPSTLKSIGLNAFLGSKIITIQCISEVPPIWEISPYGLSINERRLILQVPEQSVEAYKKSLPDFAERIQALPSN